MRILLLSDCYPPEPIVGAFRIRKVARAFAERGHQVTVVTTLAGGVTSSEDERVTLHVEEARRSPRDVLLSARGRLRRQQQSRVVTGEGVASAPAVATTGSERSAGWTKRLINGLLNLPDSQLGVVPALLHGVKRVEPSGQFDMLYSSAPSFSVQIAAALVARRLGIPWVAEYRDPWRSNGSPRYAQYHPVTNALDAWLERQCMTRADLVVAVTESAAAQFRKRRTDGKVIVSLNGIENFTSQRAARTVRDRLQVVYTGSLYSPRDPRPMLHALSRYIQRTGAAVPEIVFAGHCEAFDGEPLDQFASRIGIGEHFRLVSWMPQKDAQALVANADLLLLPAQGWHEQLPNKLFDYLGSRVPILSYADSGGETATMLQRVGGHYVATSLDQLDATVEDAMRGAAAAGTVGDGALLSEITVEKQFGYLAAEVERRIQPKLHAPLKAVA